MSALLSPDGMMATATPYVRLVGALLLALPIGWHREAHGDTMGLRTFPIVALGACAFVLIGNAFIGSGSPDAMARILQGLMTGIGFVGGGARDMAVVLEDGTAAAASIWVVGGIGAAVGFGLWGLAAALALINVLSVALLGRLKAGRNGRKADQDSAG